CSAGERCGFRYCKRGCCDASSSECCSSKASVIWAILGPVLVIAVIVIIILVCCHCRNPGIVYHSQPGNTVVVQQGSSSNTHYVTQGMQPGVVYPHYGPSAPQTQYPQHPHTGMGQMYPPQPAVPQGPPSYESLHPNQQQFNQMTSGGVVNHGYSEPRKYN
ncbi:hypothetical protein RRG08_062396, partial [Elysia crispata]